MIRNYFMVAIRNLKRQKAYSAINILGLAVGMACCILILQYVRYEFAYESQHAKSDRIYRVLRETQHTDGRSDFSWGISGLLGPTMKEELPEVEEVVRFWRHGVGMRYGEKHFKQTFAIVDSNFFDVFEFEMVDRTDPMVALQQPMSILLTENTAKRFFGSEDPIGKTITAYDAITQGDYVVTGVVKDYAPNTTLGFHFITTHFPNVVFPHRLWTKWLPGSWRMTQTYALLRDGVDIADTETKLYGIMERNLGPEVSRTDRYRLQKLSRLRLYSEDDLGVAFHTNMTIAQIYVYMTVAGLVIVIACVNFVNLSTARSMRRAREVGIRKVVGAQRGQLMRQFMVEALMIALFAGLLALALAQIALPSFNQYLGLQLTLGTAVLPWVIGLIGIVGILAGLYPAFFLSHFQPVVTLKGAQTKSNVLRNGLVVFQFAISILLMIGTLTVYDQMDYIGSRDLKYDADGLIYLGIFGRKTELRRTPESVNMVKAEFAKHPNVLSGTTMTWRNFQNASQVSVMPHDTEFSVYYFGTDEDFLDTYQVRLIAGRNVQGRDVDERGREVMINESAARILGWENPVGKVLKVRGRGSRETSYRTCTVVGVMEDFHFQSLHHPIRPLLIDNGRVDQLHLRIRATNIAETLAHCKAVWKKFASEAPFVYRFQDERLQNVYQTEKQTAVLSFACAGLAIFVACLGLLGLAAFAAERRSKEIAIRKVLGASVGSVLALLSRDFLKWIVLANVIAWPIAYFLARQWLDSFAYRIELDVGVFVVAGVLTFVIALVTVNAQTLRVARSNPVDSLQHE